MPAPTQKTATVSHRLPIEGMTCASCVKRVETAIANIPGVKTASVNLATESAEITVDTSAKMEAIVGAVKTAGYAVPRQTLDLTIEGMTCASCVRRVEQAIAAIPGIHTASVNLATESAAIEMTGNVPFATISKTIADIGYQASLKSSGTDATDQRNAAKEAEMRGLIRDLAIAATLTLPLFALEMGSHFVPGVHMWLMNTVGKFNLYILYFVLATIVQFGPGMRFYKKGVPALLRFAPEMNALVVLGSSAAWAYSVVATFSPQILPAGTANVYFEASAVIITLILLGRLLEARAKGRTSEAIKRLMGLQAKTAQVERDGTFAEIPLEEVNVGDIIRVRPGDKVPVDGEVTAGTSYVDEAMISGEPAPVAKAEGDDVIGGTINKSGSFTYRATKVGADTVLAQIIQMVETAQGSKLPIQALVDQVTAWFVPAVMLAAVITFGIWLTLGPDPALSFALVNAVAVLIIACPCAMGLATPTSIMVGTGRAAEMGVLFRNGEALQSLKGTRVVALDKTGTLTLGHPALTDFNVVNDFDHDHVLSLVASAEAGSEHPVAEAIVAAAKSKDLTVLETKNFEAHAGFGITAEVGDHKLHIGADRFMEQQGLDLAAHTKTINTLASDAKTPLFAAIDGTLAAIIAVADPIKPSTPKAIDALHALGLKVAMITGDNKQTAQAIAEKLGIDEVIAEVLPDGKVDAIKRLRADGRIVSFVGDGINDAPALAEADVGIAIGTGTDVAIESADIVLMSGNLTGVVNAISLSKATLANIRQNLFWAFAYNASLIPVAAGVLYPFTGTLLSPMLAAGAMALSSVFVLGNALRLKSFAAPLDSKETSTSQ